MPERQVVFYAYEDVEDAEPFDRLVAVSGINQLDDADWRVPDIDGDSEIGVIVDQVGDAKKPSRLRFLRIRADAPFVLSAARKLTPVQVRQDERISEFIHVVLWPSGYMGASALATRHPTSIFPITSRRPPTNSCAWSIFTTLTPSSVFGN